MKMVIFWTRFLSICLLITLTLSEAADGKVNGSTSDAREPRVTGRIVKLYSGTRPEPVLCAGEGFQADPHDCSVFYRCMKSGRGKFTVYKFSCGPGTVYDPETEVCNHPRNTKRAECGGLLSPLINTSEHDELNKIEGVQEVPSPITTKKPAHDKQPTTVTPTSRKPSTITDNIFGMSMPEIISDIYNSITTKPFGSNLYQIQSSPVTHMTPSTISPIVTISNHLSNDNVCTTDGFMGDTENCRKFYRCVANQNEGYTRYEFYCSETTIWDDDIQGCNHAWAVKRSRCGRSHSYQNKLTNSNEILKTDVVRNTEKTTGTKEIEPDQFKQKQQIINYDPKITQTNPQISNEPIKKNHTPVYASERNDKTKISKVKQNQTEIGHNSAHNQTQIQTNYIGIQEQLHKSNGNDIISTYSTTSKTKQAEDNICVQSGFMGYENDCKKFYRCVDDGKGRYTRFEFSCSDGTAWDQEIEACNHVWAVKKCDSSVSYETSSQIINTVSTIQPVQQTTASQLTQNYETTISTTKSYHTTHILIDNTDDDNDNGYGNQNLHTTLMMASEIKTTTTEIPNVLGTECKYSGFIGDVHDCKIFYRCVENGEGTFTKYEFKCGEGTVWDQNMEACNHAWAVKHCGGAISNNINETEETTTKQTTSPPFITQHTTTTDGSTLPQNNDHDVGYGSQSNDISLTTTTTESHQNLNNTIDTVCKQSGFTGDENDCKKFYRCVDNGSGSFTQYNFTCGEGTVWDSKIEACNHEWAVDKCGKGESTTLHQEFTSESLPTSTNDDTQTTTAPTVTSKVTDTTILVSTDSTSSSVPALISTETNKCIHSGFMADHKDCKKFYRCVDDGNGFYTRYEFLCGEGTVWDSKIEACNHAWAVEKCGGIITSTDSSPTSTPLYHVTEHDEFDNSYGSNGQTQETHYSSSTQTITSSKPTTKEPEDSNQNNFCKNSGFIGDKTNCKKFYRCVDDGNGGYIRYEFDCGEGTLWDQSIEACNHASEVKNCYYTEIDTSTSTPFNYFTTEITETTLKPDDQGHGQDTEKTSTTGIYHENEATNICNKEGFIGDKNNCKIFYRCVDDGHGNYTKYEFTCGDGTYWNQEILSCDHETSDKSCKSKDTEMTTQMPHIEHDEISTATTIISNYTTEHSNEASSTQTHQLSGICYSDGFYGDTSDCKKFYRCVDNGSGSYTKYDFTCGDGTIWDQEIQSCNHESPNNKCIGSTSSNLSESLSSSSPSTTEIENSIDKTETPPSTATNQCTSEGYFAVSDDCKKFIRCVSDTTGGFTKYEFTCGEGTVWIQDILACDHDDGSSNCRFNTPQFTTKPQATDNLHPTSEEPLVTNTLLQSEVTDEPIKLEDEYNDVSSSHSPEISDCTSEGFYGNEYDCKRFYRCVANGNGGFTKYDFTCGEGTGWDEEIQTCNHIDQVKSCYSSNEGSTTTSSVMHDENNDHTTDVISSTTSKATSSTDSSQNMEITDSCTEEGYFGDTTDCKKFYRCVDNGKGSYIKYDYTCGDGTIWDQDITTCNHPQDVTNPSCSQGESSTSGTTTSTEKSSEPSGSTSQSTSSATTESSTQSSSNCSQEESPNKTEATQVNCTKEGFYPNPNDCKKFYRCVDWDGDGKRFSVYHFECGEGTIWDPAVETCNHEESVYPPRNCSGTQPQAENMYQETTTTDSTTTKREDTTSFQESTTIQASTTEQTASQESTTSDGSTTQQSTTLEPTTTQQSTISAGTTTQPSNTSDQTTTQQSTTSTTQSTTTAAQTTTQQSPSEQTTTQNSELTTTDQATTNQQTTSSEQSTTEQSTITEQTTTQKSTTSNPTTTEESTSEPTTKKTTTSEQTTTEQSTTSKITTEENTTSEVTTAQQSTTSETSTEYTSTTDQTTQQSTTEYSTTEQSKTTTEGSSTDETTSSGGTTESTTEQSTTEQSTNSNTTTTEETTSKEECPETDDDQFLFVCPTSFKRHPKYCNMFYQCTEDDSHDVKIATFTCPNSTIYDESQTKCVEESKAEKKCNGEIAQKRRFKKFDMDYKEPIIASTQSYACYNTGYFPFENTQCSPAFLKCEIDKSKKLRGYVHQCPTGYVYWSVSKRCERIQQMANCERSSNDWSGRWGIPIERRNIAT